MVLLAAEITLPRPVLICPCGRYGGSVHGAIERLLESMALPLLCAPPGAAHAPTATITPPDGQTPFERLRAVEAALARSGAGDASSAAAAVAVASGDAGSNRPPRRVLQEEARLSLRRALEAPPTVPGGGRGAADGGGGGGTPDVWAWEECARLTAQLDHLEAAGTRKARPWNV